MSNLINVRYIGAKDRKEDNVALSGAVWHGHGDVQAVTPEVWGKLSRFPEVWERVDDLAALVEAPTEGEGAQPDEGAQEGGEPLALGAADAQPAKRGPGRPKGGAKTAQAADDTKPTEGEGA